MTDIPKGATVPQDRKKSAAQIEAEGIETTTTEWRDLSFTVPTDPDDWPAEVLLLFEKGQNANGLQEILGPKQWAKFMATKPRKRDVLNLFEVLGESLGLGE